MASLTTARCTQPALCSPKKNGVRWQIEVSIIYVCEVSIIVCEDSTINLHEYVYAFPIGWAKWLLFSNILIFSLELFRVENENFVLTSNLR